MKKRFYSRRELLGRLGGGIAGVALTDMLARQGLSAAPQSLLAPKQPHFGGKAKAVISVFCYGGVSQVDTFDPKPELAQASRRGHVGCRRRYRFAGAPGRDDALAVEFQEIRRIRD